MSVGVYLFIYVFILSTDTRKGRKNRGDGGKIKVFVNNNINKMIEEFLLDYYFILIYLCLLGFGF